jgi:hypothetical protein
MRPLLYFFMIAGTVFFLQSCEFNCSVGDKKNEEEKGAAVVKDGARIYNNIELNFTGVKISKAFLLLANGKRVPDDNFVDFKSPVKMQLAIDSGWVEQNGKVLLGASEKIITEEGAVLVNEQDLFQKYPDGVSVADSKSIYLSATVKLKEGAAPTFFTVSFRIWDKQGNGNIEGNYKLYSK